MPLTSKHRDEMIQRTHDTVIKIEAQWKIMKGIGAFASAVLVGVIGWIVSKIT